MLRISVEETKDKRVLVLEGKLIDPWANELKSICEGGGHNSDPGKLIIDIAGLTSISGEGEEALLYCLLRGATFRGSGMYMKQVLQQLAQRISGNDEK